MQTTIGVLAFGHVHFKAACAAEGLRWQDVKHVTHVAAFKGVTRLIVHSTASDRRQSHLVIEAQRLKLINNKQTETLCDS